MIGLTLERGSPTPLQLQIYQFFYLRLRRGDYRKGQKLPSIRALSRELGVARNTVIQTYEKLVECGMVQNQPGRGFYVVYDRPLAPVCDEDAPSPVEDILFTPPTGTPGDLYIPNGAGQLYCRLGVPDACAFPWARWRRWNNQPTAKKERMLTRYHPPEGLLPLREEVARYLALARGINCNPANVIITNGIQEGLALACQVLLRDEHHRHVVAESPCYSGAWYLFKLYQARVTPVPVDSHGLISGLLPEAATRLCYVTPAHQYPLGSIMTMARREALLAWAERTGAWVFEDDYDASFSFDDRPLAALRSLKQGGRVIYAGTFSKILGPGMRLGYLVVPDCLLALLQNAKALMNSGSSWLLQAFLAAEMSSQRFYTHLSKLEHEYSHRQRRLMQGLQPLFPGAEFCGTGAGLHFSIVLDKSREWVQTLQQLALLLGVRFDTLATLSNGSENPWNLYHGKQVLLLGYGGLTQPEIDRVVDALGRALRQLER